MSIAITTEQQALSDSIDNWARRTKPVDAVRAAAHGTEQLRGTRGLADIGVFAIGVPEELGGAGASTLDAVVGVAEAAKALSSGPIFGSVLAGLVLGKVADTPVAKDLVPALARGDATAAVGFMGEPVLASSHSDGGIVVHGDAGLVIDADEQAHLILAADLDGSVVWFVLEPGHAGARITRSTPVDFSRALGRVELDGVHVPHDALLPAECARGIRSTAVTLACAEASGVAEWCVHTASEHAKIREQFGKPIGSFQAIKHLCANMLCRAQVAAALAWDAARAADESLEQHELASATASASVLDLAVRNAKDCIQVLGGIGFTWEHDAHLYLRRALGLRQILGGGSPWRKKAAELVLAGTRRRLDIDPRRYADLTVCAEGQRDAIRDTVAELSILGPQAQRNALAETGYLMPHWPSPYGLDAEPAQQLIIDSELSRAGVTRTSLVIGGWAAPTILEHGSEQQKEKFIWPTLRGEITWCQLFSEPGSGSDLASLSTKATKVDGGWQLAGQKVWTSLAREADWAICLARTDPNAAKHRGITYFLVDMRADGITARPLREITGDRMFNEVFLDDVFVPDENVVGNINDGWRLARTTLASERVAMSGGSAIGEGVERLAALISAAGLDNDAVVVDALGALVAEGSAGSLLDLRGTIRRLQGHDSVPESSVRKLVGVRHRQDVAETALELTGSSGAALDDRTAEIVHEFLLSRSLSIAGGTTQVLLNIAAERLLGLPRG